MKAEMSYRLPQLCLVCMATSMFGQTPTAKAPPAIVRQIDHIVVQADTVANAQSLWSLFSKTLDLPIAWAPAQYNGFFSGGVSAGNVNLEFAYFKDESDSGFPPQDGIARARFSELGLEPEPLAEAIARLDAIGFRHGKPNPYQVQDQTGKKATLWTTVYLHELSKNMEVFLCEYSDDLFRTNNPPRRDIQDNRRYLMDQLRQRNGGPLSIDSVEEVVIETSSYEKNASLWGKLVNGTSPRSKGVLKPSQGPGLLLVPSGSDAIQSIVIRVTDLGRARRFLEEHGLLGKESKDKIAIDSTKVMGLDVQLVQSH